MKVPLWILTQESPEMMSSSREFRPHAYTINKYNCEASWQWWMESSHDHESIWVFPYPAWAGIACCLYSYLFPFPESNLHRWRGTKNYRSQGVRFILKQKTGVVMQYWENISYETHIRSNAYYLIALRLVVVIVPEEFFQEEVMNNKCLRIY